MESAINSNKLSRADLSSSNSPKDKRYLAQIEKAISTFYSVEEWADYITFLSRLLKALSFPEKNRTVLWIPHQDQVLNKLALCLSPALPSGVHQKTLAVYASIFDALTIKELNRLIYVWLPGLLLLLSYGSTQVKPQLLALYQQKIIENLEPETLKMITKPIILSLLSGIDDENSEIYGDSLHLLEQFKEKLASNAHFWKQMFLCIISNPEKRIGAFNWCLTHLPVFSTIQLGKDKVYSSEAQACIEDRGGLLIRAFAASLNTVTSFNPATDIIVIRGFFDLLLARLPLDSPLLTELVDDSDKLILIMACVRTTLKKEMSLNRRLWAWLLGPTSSSENLDPTSRKKYFSQYALPYVDKGLLSLLNGSSVMEKTSAIRMSLSLVIDKWEISQLVTPIMFASILETCKSVVANDEPYLKELIHETKLFFNQVEAFYIWRYITCELIAEGNDESMLLFILKNFDLPDDQSFQHIHLAVLVYLLKIKVDEKTTSTLETLISLCRPELLLAQSKSENHDLLPDLLIKKIEQYYVDLSEDENACLDLESLIVTHLLLNNLEKLYISFMRDSEFSLRFSKMFCSFIFAVPHIEDTDAINSDLKQAVLQFPIHPSTNSDNIIETAPIFALAKLTRHLVRTMTHAESSRLLKILISNFWAVLASPFPAQNQVEAVKAIFELASSFNELEVEAGIVTMVLSSSLDTRYKAFQTLWTHFADIQNSQAIIAGAVFPIFDGLHILGSKEYMDVSKFLSTAIKEGSVHKLLEIVTEPLMIFLANKGEKESWAIEDDFAQVVYHLQVLKNVILSDRRAMRDVLNREFVAAESLAKFLTISKTWNVSNYKSLFLKLLKELFLLKISLSDADLHQNLNAVSECTSLALDLYSTCAAASDANFDEMFSVVVDSCSYYIEYSKNSDGSVNEIVLAYLRTINNIIHTAKVLNVYLSYGHSRTNGSVPKISNFIVNALTVCNSPRLLNAWFQLSNSMLHILKGSILEYLLGLSSVIIEKIRSNFEALQRFSIGPYVGLSEESLGILLSGLENLMIVIHSHIIRSVSAATSSAQGENGFLGNVFSGVFQIEAPQVRSDEEKTTILVLDAISQASLAVYEIWDWADSQPSSQLPNFASQHSVKYFANKVRFKSKKVMESLGDLEKQRVIETILAAPKTCASKIKILHLLDSGRAQLTVPHIFSSIKGQCYPPALTEKERIYIFSGIEAKQLSSFLPRYTESIDYDIVEDLWDQILKFMKDVLAHISHYTCIMFDLLDVMRILAIKMKGKNVNYKDLATQYLNCFNAILSRRTEIINLTSEQAFYHELEDKIKSFSSVFQEQERIHSLVATIINTVIVPKLKLKTELLPIEVPNLLVVIGDNYPTKIWKQVIYDTFTDNLFFYRKRFMEESWKRCSLLWITNDSERFVELYARVSPSQPAPSANIFLWGDSSEVTNTVMCLKRLTYLLLVQSSDAFGPQLSDLLGRLTSTWKSTTSPLVQSEVLTFLRAVTLKFSESHLLPHWGFIIQSISESFLTFLDLSSKELNQLSQEPLCLLLSTCKLLDQLLLLNFDEFNISSWLFVGEGSITEETEAFSYIDRLARKTETLMSKDTPILISPPKKDELSKPLLLGVREIKSAVMLKVFFGLLSYINYERTYGLYSGSKTACESEIFADLAGNTN